jgi:hypothetical protein
MQRMHRYEAGSLHGALGGRENGRIMGVRSQPVLLEQAHAFPKIGHVRSVDPELLADEDKLGCARGVMWAVAFEAAVVITGIILWKLRFYLH